MSNDDFKFEIPWWLKGLVKAAGVLRSAGLRDRIVIAKHYVTLQTLFPLHLEAVHAMRRLASDALHGPGANDAHFAAEAMHVCTALNKTMGAALDLGTNELHCSIKVFLPPDRIGTLARSEPMDDRPLEMGPENARPLTDGTVWCALMGQNDGRTHWRRYQAFACNDLPDAHRKGKLRCGRPDWQDYYQSVLVYPLLYRSDGTQKGTVFGFLGFDSPRAGAFLGAPNIFDHMENDGWGKYHERLNRCSVFHLGAILADSLSVFMRPYYQRPDGAQVVQAIADSMGEIPRLAHEQQPGSN
ncbi:MAG TPA: hypothetical protein VIN36_09155 [Thiobacillus sp.]